MTITSGQLESFAQWNVAVDGGDGGNGGDGVGTGVLALELPPPPHATSSSEAATTNPVRISLTINGILVVSLYYVQCRVHTYYSN
ncbi:MAG: hypothetical protein HKM98_07270 [Gammaproteobacteria bacterium]|nr:hypothetical protein [Gammaproteobacteria bacterium]